jgi:ABC-type polysaccharide/polyol phosphate transport system ATPase subunit
VSSDLRTTDNGPRTTHGGLRTADHVAIRVRDLHKTYRRYGRRHHFATLKSALLSGNLLRDLQPDDVFEALRGVTFDVHAGRSFGVVGRNGSGKSTLLKLIAGIGRPTSGTVVVDGRVSALIELGAGFHPEISGRENVFINGMMLGLSKKEIARRFDGIVSFAELQEFIDAPVKTYSSGMYVRLGFAVAINVDPDVLLVDEVLAVGDEAFTHKCLDTFAEFKRRGKTILIVTHQLGLVERFCDEALWLDRGVVKAQGDPKRVIDAYRMDVAASEAATKVAALPTASAAPGGIGSAETRTGIGSAGSHTPGTRSAGTSVPGTANRWGSREVEITRVELAAPSGATTTFEWGTPMEIRFAVRAAQPTRDFVFGIGIFNAEGVCCYGSNTQIEGATPGELAGDAEVRVAIDRLDLVPGSYTLDVAVHRENGAPYDYHRQLYSFRVTSRVQDLGIYRPHHRWHFAGGVRIAGLE